MDSRLCNLILTPARILDTLRALLVPVDYFLLAAKSQANGTFAVARLVVFLETAFLHFQKDLALLADSGRLYVLLGSVKSFKDLIFLFT